MFRTESFDEDEQPTRLATLDGFTADESALLLDDAAWDEHCREQFGKVPMGNVTDGK